MDTPSILRSKPNQLWVELSDEYWALFYPSSSPSYWQYNLKIPKTHEWSCTTKYLEDRSWEIIWKHGAMIYENRWKRKRFNFCHIAQWYQVNSEGLGSHLRKNCCTPPPPKRRPKPGTYNCGWQSHQVSWQTNDANCRFDNFKRVMKQRSQHGRC